MQKIIVMIFFLFVWFLGVGSGCYAEWIGPIEVVAGKWGKEKGEFGYKKHHVEDGFPKNFYINNQGYIYVVDSINNVIHKYNQKGQLIKTIQKPSAVSYWELMYTYNYYEAWVYFNPEGGFMVKGFKSWQFFGVNDDFIVEKEILANDFPFVYDGYLFKDRNNITYSHYSINGELIGRYDEEQLKKKGIIGDGGFLTLQLLHRSGNWKSLMKQRMPFAMQVRLNSRKSFLVLPTQCGVKEIFFELPKNKVIPLRPVFEKDPVGYRSWKPDVYTIYRSPTLSLDDDFYCVKYHRYVQEKYSIIKWVWTDGANTPFDLMNSTTNASIVLTWRKPKRDSESVTEYEINRSTEVCGSYSPISKVNGNTCQFVDKDVKKGTAYYYKVRAIRKNTYSGFSDEARGEIR